METQQKEWAQLVCSTDLDSLPILIHADSFSIGRAKACDLSISDNKVISGKHCVIARHQDGTTWLEDSSTNGTWVNNNKVGKGQKLQVTHGDEIFLVRKPGIANVAYLFQETAELDKEMIDQTLELNDEESEENTENYDYESKTDQSTDDVAPTGRVKRDRSEDSSDDEQASKKLHTEPVSKEELPDTGSKQEGSHKPDDISLTASQIPGPSRDVNTTNPRLPAGDKGSLDPFGDSEATPTEAPEQDDIAESLMCSICQDIFHDCISLQPCMHSFCAACYSSWMAMANTCPTCRIRVDRINKNHIVNNLCEAYLKKYPDKKRSEDELKEMNEKNKITRDMLIPKQNRGGDGRLEFIFISDDDDESDENSLLSDSEDDSDDDDAGRRVGWNLFGIGQAGGLGLGIHQPAFVPRPQRSICRQCPGYVAPPSTDPNIGTVLNLTPADSTNTSTTTSGSADGACCKVKDDTKDSASTQAPSLGKKSKSKTKGKATTPNTACKSDTDKPSTSAGPQASCGSTATTNKPSGDDGNHQIRITPSGEVVSMPTMPAFQCVANGNHILCMCCRHPMPDRRGTASVSPQKCSLCNTFYCHMYWGCQKIDCLGCLNKLKDMNFGDKCLKNVVNNNTHESEILKKYLQANNKTWRDVLSESVTKLDAGQYTCPDTHRQGFTSESPVCYKCGFKNFQQLAYQYRKDIPRGQLPAEVVARSDCYWGKSCRTQFCKPHHAQRFNHICDQTRF